MIEIHYYKIPTESMEFGEGIAYYEVKNSYAIRQIEIYDKMTVCLDENNFQTPFFILCDQPMLYEKYMKYEIDKKDFESLWVKLNLSL